MAASKDTRYQAIFENSPVSIWEEDFSAVKALLDGLHREGIEDLEAYLLQHPETVQQCAELVRILDVNQATLNLHGARSKAELLAGLVNTFTQESFDTFREELIAIWRGDTTLRRDAMVKTLGGEHRHVTINFAVCPGYEESLAKVFISLTDITERKHSEENLRRSEETLKIAQRIAHLGSWHMELATSEVYWSEELYKMYGFDPTLPPPLYTESAKLFTPESWELLSSSIARVVETGIPYEIELEMVPKTGERKWMLARGELVRDAYGNPLRVQGVVMDITAKKQIELERRNRTDYFVNIDRVNRAIQGANDLEGMMRDVLDEVLDIFGCDRAFLMYPCDPSAKSWTVPMERTHPEYPGAGILKEEVPMNEEVATTLEQLLNSTTPVKYSSGKDQPLPGKVAERYSVKAFMSLALFPKIGKPWQFGVHQCSYARVWTEAEEHLLAEIGRRLADALSTMLAQRDLRQSEEKYRRIIDTANEGVLILDEHENVTFFNTHLAKMLGYTLAELEGRLVTEFMLKDDLANHRQRLASRQQNVAEIYERRLIRKDGSLLWVLVSASPIFEEGRFCGALSMLTDITELKRAEEELRESERRLVEAQNLAHIGNWELDLIKDELAWSDGIYRIFEIDKEKFGESYEAFLDAIHPDDRERVNNAYTNSLKTKQPYNIVHRLLMKDGRVKFVNERCETFYDPTGKALRSVGTVQDITEQKLREDELARYRDHLAEEVNQRTEELRLARDAADAANKAKSVFLANMSHELRTPLNAILGFSHMMQRDANLNDSQQDTLDIITSSGEHLLKLINDVLEIAKIEAGKLQLEIASFDLHSLVQEVSDMMRLRAEQKGLTLELVQSPEFPRYVKGDEARLRQILVNLISNAVKFTEKGSVTIRLNGTDNSQHHLQIEIEDTGIGISAIDQQKLFRPFQQLTADGSEGGTGLGLAIVKQFVSLMNGTITVKSQPGKGSLFSVELPLAHADDAEVDRLGIETPGEVIGMAPGQTARRILIAEDQLDNQFLLARLMTDIGMNVRTANDGEECVRIFEEWHPDMIWMDRRMPIVDGVEATRLIRQLQGGDKVKIVAVTASAFTEQQQELLDAGMDGFVRKPFRFVEIYETLTQQLGVKLIYRDTEQEAARKVSNLTPEMLADLNDDLRIELRQALDTLDSAQIKAVIKRIKEEDKTLAKTLKYFASNYDYPSILHALDHAPHTEEEK